MPRGKKELAEQIIPKLREVEVEVGRGKTVLEAVKKIGVTERLKRCSETKVLIERSRQHYNTIRPHSALGYRPPAPEAWQPRAFASATPSLLGEKTLT